MEFKVSANSTGPVGVDQFDFKISTTTLSVTNAQLFVYTDSAYSQAAPGPFGASTGQFGATVATPLNGTAFAITATTNPLEIPAGQTYYFQLRGTVAGSASGASAVTTLNGDSAYPSLAGFVSNPGALGSPNFIWTANSTTTNSLTGSDYTNGYGIAGLPASGLFQARSN